MQFTYQARTPEGEERSGTIEARSLEGATEILQRNNLIIVEIQPAAGAASIFKQQLRFFDHVSQRDVVIFSRQLATLFEAQVPLVQAFKTLAGESENIVFRTAIGEILEDASGGSSLSQAFSRHPHIFSQFYVNMVRAGEESGKLGEVFSFLADHLERSYALTSKARTSLIYPAFIFSAFVGVIVVMLVVVVPRISDIFKEIGTELPIYTRAIIGLSSFFRAWGIWLLILLAIGAVFLWRFLLTERGRDLWDAIKIRLPLIGGLLRKIYLTRLTDNLATLIVAGIPIIRALQITADVVQNRVYAKIILAASDSVRGGSTISYAFERYNDIPPIITQMIKIGEESGRLDVILKSAARFYQRDVDNLLDNFVSLIEPALIIMLGLGVGVLVAAVLFPLYNLSSIL
ncbi:MAG: type II secretion system F family protein [Candidatus Sungbacteria bacterium]|nr:type II secretion system F family protein [Candidatus Sungbacteria bacterium]